MFPKPTEVKILAQEIYNWNVHVGWWDDPDRCIFTTFQLISTEIAEATEGERKNLMDDHLPHRKMGEVELADAVIRLLDLAGKFGWEYNQNFPAHAWCRNAKRNSTIGKLHLGLNAALVDLAEEYSLNSTGPQLGTWYSVLLSSLCIVAFHQHYDLWAAVDEKIEYNKTRADHKRENRAKENGKKF